MQPNRDLKLQELSAQSSGIVNVSLDALKARKALQLEDCEAPAGKPARLVHGLESDIVVGNVWQTDLPCG